MLDAHLSLFLDAELTGFSRSRLSGNMEFTGSRLMQAQSYSGSRLMQAQSYSGSRLMSSTSATSNLWTWASYFLYEDIRV